MITSKVMSVSAHVLESDYFIITEKMNLDRLQEVFQYYYDFICDTIEALENPEIPYKDMNAKVS